MSHFACTERVTCKVMTNKHYDTVSFQRKTSLPVLRRRRWRNAPEVERRSPYPLPLTPYPLPLTTSPFLSGSDLIEQVSGETAKKDV
jgi:hypothetical protein